MCVDEINTELYIPISLKAHSFGTLPAFLYRFDIDNVIFTCGV